MRRIAAGLLILCAGCAAPGSQTATSELWYGDLRALFSEGDRSTTYETPIYTNGYGRGNTSPAPRTNP